MFGFRNSEAAGRCSRIPAIAAANGFGSGSVGSSGSERVRLAVPARQVDVTARPFLAGHGLREEARPQAHRRRHLLRGELREHRAVGRRQPATGREVQLEEPRPGFGVHRGELDVERLECAHQRVHEPVVAADLAQAVADPARQRLAVLVPDTNLVLDGRHHVVAERRHVVEDRSVHLPGGEIARAPVGPRRRREADPPPEPPREVADRLDVRGHEQVGRAGADPEALVVGDRRVHRIQPEDQVGHHGSVLHGGLERRRAQRLAAERAVHVGDREEHELLGTVPRAHPVPAADKEPSTDRWTASIVARNRSTICASSSSEVT